jgi:hypothetical protein
MTASERIQKMRAKLGLVRKSEPPAPKPRAQAKPPQAQEKPRPAQVEAPQPARKKARGGRAPDGVKFRLPEGTTFTATYDGAMQLWRVTMAVPGLEPTQTASRGVHAALQQLGRAWLKEHGTPAAAAPETAPTAGAA